MPFYTWSRDLIHRNKKQVEFVNNTSPRPPNYPMSKPQEPTSSISEPKSNGKAEKTTPCIKPDIYEEEHSKAPQNERREDKKFQRCTLECQERDSPQINLIPSVGESLHANPSHERKKWGLSSVRNKPVWRDKYSTKGSISDEVISDENYRHPSVQVVKPNRKTVLSLKSFALSETCNGSISLQPLNAKSVFQTGTCDEEESCVTPRGLTIETSSYLSSKQPSSTSSKVSRRNSLFDSISADAEEKKVANPKGMLIKIGPNESYSQNLSTDANMKKFESQVSAQSSDSFAITPSNRAGNDSLSSKITRNAESDSGPRKRSSSQTSASLTENKSTVSISSQSNPNVHSANHAISNSASSHKSAFKSQAAEMGDITNVYSKNKQKIESPSVKSSTSNKLVRQNKSAEIRSCASNKSHKSIVSTSFSTKRGESDESDRIATSQKSNKSGGSIVKICQKKVSNLKSPLKISKKPSLSSSGSKTTISSTNSLNMIEGGKSHSSIRKGSKSPNETTPSESGENDLSSMGSTIEVDKSIERYHGPPVQIFHNESMSHMSLSAVSSLHSEENIELMMSRGRDYNPLPSSDNENAPTLQPAAVSATGVSGNIAWLWFHYQQRWLHSDQHACGR